METFEVWGLCALVALLSAIFGAAYGLRLGKHVAELVVNRERNQMSFRQRARIIAGIRGRPAEWVEAELIAEEES